MGKNNKNVLKLLPVLFSFFIMGFVDVVNISTSYVKSDFCLSDKVANLLPMMVFVWFAVCSLPVGKLMNRIGRKSTVLLSAAITIVAMSLPLLSYNFPIVLTAFALLGIGNTVLQVSLNPLLTDVTDASKTTSMLTLGQFIKAISSTLGPVIIGLVCTWFGQWKLILPIYGVITVISLVWLWLTPIKEQDQITEKKSGSIKALLSDSYIIFLFLAIMLSVGFEIGLMTTVPKYLLERFGMALEVAGLGCSLYYLARTAGTFLGSFLLAKVSPKKYLVFSVFLGLIALAAFLIVQSKTALFVCLFCIGLFCANIFPIVFGAALQAHKEMANEVSSLMIMGVAGGALIPPVMGIISDISNQWTSLFVLVASLACILIIALNIKEENV